MGIMNAKVEGVASDRRERAERTIFDQSVNISLWSNIN